MKTSSNEEYINKNRLLSRVLFKRQTMFILSGGVSASSDRLQSIAARENWLGCYFYQVETSL